MWTACPPITGRTRSITSSLAYLPRVWRAGNPVTSPWSPRCNVSTAYRAPCAIAI
jgi:hypothetical protein